MKLRRSHAGGLLEQAMEVKLAQPCHRRESVQIEFLVGVRLDPVRHLLEFEARKRRTLSGGILRQLRIVTGEMSGDELRQSLEKTSVIGTHSFDQSLLDLYQRGLIEQEVALSNADSRTDLGLRMRLRSSHDPH